MEQSELLAGPFETSFLFEVFPSSCWVQNTLFRDTIKVGSYWSIPKPDIRPTEHITNFGMSILIVQVPGKSLSSLQSLKQSLKQKS